MNRMLVATYRWLARALPRRWEPDRAGLVEDFRLILDEASVHGQWTLGIGLRGLWDLAVVILGEWWGLAWGEGSRSNPSSGGSRPGVREGAMNLIQDVQLAARSLMRRPGFSAVAALTLALGIGASTAIYTVVDTVLLRPLPFEDSDRIVVVQHHAPALDLPELEMSDGLFNYYTEAAPFLSSVAAFDLAQRNLTGGEQPAQVRVLIATPELFEVLRVAPARGRIFNPSDVEEGAAPVAILTHPSWQGRFGSDPAVLGRRIELDGVSTEIIGVMPAGFAFPDEDPIAITPRRVDPEGQFGAFGSRGIARLAAGVLLDQADARMKDLQTRLPERFPDLNNDFLDQTGWNSTVRTLRDVMVEDVQSTLWIVLGTVGLVLLIACANVANLFLVRAEGRQKEMAVRAALGAGRSSIAITLLSETFLLGLVGGAAGLVIAWVGVRALVAMGPDQLPRLHEIGLDSTSIGFALLMSLAAGLVLGFLPLMRYAGGRMAGVLRDGGRTNTIGRSRHRARNALVASQLALALVLLVGSGLMLRSFAALRSVDPGFDASGVLTVGLSRGETDDRVGAARFYQAVADQVAALPGVDVVGIVSHVPLATGSTTGGSFEIESRPQDDDALPPVAMYKAMGPGYFASMGIRLIEGREMVRADWEEGRAVAWVNETFATTFLDGRIAGERIRWDGDDDVEFAEVVGIVADTKELELTDEASPLAYIPMLINGWSYPGLESASLTVRMAEGQDPNSIVPAVRRIVGQTDPNVPLTNARTMTSVVSESMAATSFTMTLLNVATGVALFLGAIGLFAVVSYVVSQRTREIGVRMALGAQSRAVRRMVVHQGLAVTLVGTVLGLAGALALTRLMQTLLFDVSATDPATFLAAPVLLIAVSLVATWLPARRAAGVDPVEALRSE